MSWMLSVVLMVMGLSLVGGMVHLWRGHRRAQGARLQAGEAATRDVDQLSVRLYIDKSLAGGPRAPGGRDRARMVVSETRFVLSTGHGRVLEIGEDRPGSVRCTGPRRLVVEGLHPSGRARVRAELVVDDAEGWQAAAEKVPGTQRAAI